MARTNRRTLQHSLRRTLRTGARRASGAAAGRYRTAVLERSRWLPAYLRAVDATDVALRTARAARRRPAPDRPWDEPDPAAAAVLRAALSATGELSLVLIGPTAWQRSVGGVALVSGGVRMPLDDGLLERAAQRVQLCVPLLPGRLAAGRWQVVLLDVTGAELPTPPVAKRAVRTRDGRRSIHLEVDGDALVLVREQDDPATIGHRVSTGIARITVEWTPPPDAPDELLLLGASGAIVCRVPGAPTSADFAFAASVVELPTAETELTVAVPGPDAPVPLVLVPGEYPRLFAAPLHGSARLGRSQVHAAYDAANRLQLRIDS